jgi:tetratricopeptide (TPR) repeat protein
MTQSFDPYYLWLGIPLGEQPADHYRLLGLSKFESEGEVIRDAAERQMAHVRHYELGKHGGLSQQILNELGRAKACLLDESKKADYDHNLRQHTKAQADVTVPPPVPDQEPETAQTVTAPPPVALNVRVSASRPEVVKWYENPYWKVSSIVVPGLVVVMLLLLLVRSRDDGNNAPRGGSTPERLPSEPAEDELLDEPLTEQTGANGNPDETEPRDDGGKNISDPLPPSAEDESLLLDRTDTDPLVPVPLVAPVDDDLPSLAEMTQHTRHFEIATGFFDKAVTDFDLGNRPVARDGLLVAIRRYPGYLLGEGLSLLVLTSSADDKLRFRNWGRHYNEGLDKKNQGLYREAFRSYQSAIEVAPIEVCKAWALNNFAYDLVSCPDAELRDAHLATSYSHEACELTRWQYWVFLGTLARCYSSVGQYEQAERVAQAYLKNAPPEEVVLGGEPPVNREEMDHKLQRFRLRRPWEDLPSAVDIAPPGAGTPGGSTGQGNSPTLAP